MYRTIVDAETLHEHIEDAQWVIIDCRHSLQDFSLGRRVYEEGHIPGAFLADFEHDLAGKKTGANGRHPLPDLEAFAGFLRSCRVGNDTQIVAYDEGGDMYAARLWFLSRWIGHDAVAVLDGGLAAWRTLGYPLAKGTPPSHAEAKGTELTVHLRPEFVVNAGDVLASIGSNEMLVLDARAGDRFRGEVEPLDRVAGHIPGAQNRWFKENFDANGRLKSPEKLQEEFARYGDPSRVVHQCGSGVSSAVTLLAMEHAGLHGSRLYNGSWSEWASDPKRPVATGN